MCWNCVFHPLNALFSSYLYSALLIFTSWTIWKWISVVLFRLKSLYYHRLSFRVARSPVLKVSLNYHCSAILLYFHLSSCFDLTLQQSASCDLKQHMYVFSIFNILYFNTYQSPLTLTNYRSKQSIIYWNTFHSVNFKYTRNISQSILIL